MTKLHAKIEILCDGVIVASGTIGSINVARARLTIPDFPLDVATFLEIAIRSESGGRLRIPVRAIAHDAEGLEVAIECLDPEILSAIAGIQADNRWASTLHGSDEH